MEKNCSITVLTVLILTTHLPLSASLILTSHVYFVAVQDITTFTHVSQSLLNQKSKCYHHYHMPGDRNKINSGLISDQLPQMVTSWDPRQRSRQVPSWNPSPVPSWNPSQVPSWDPSQVPRQIPGWSPSKVPGQVPS